MNWGNFLFGVGLVAGGAVGGALLMRSYLLWPVTRDTEIDDVDVEEEIAAARTRHPSTRRHDLG